MSLLRLIYRSRTTQVQKYSTLTDILKVAVEHNSRHHITGLLGYARNFFFQCLEGAPEDVSRLLGRIYRDPRHTDLVILDAREVSTRLFPDWGMKLIMPEDLPSFALRLLFEGCEGDAMAQHLSAERLSAFFTYMADSSLSQDPRAVATNGSPFNR